MIVCLSLVLKAPHKLVGELLQLPDLCDLPSSLGVISPQRECALLRMIVKESEILVKVHCVIRVLEGHLCKRLLH